MRKLAVIWISCSLMVLCACAVKTRALENMTSSDTGEYKAIVWGDKTYVPFCAVSNEDRGKKIGVVDGDKNDQVYEYKGFSADEWVISFYHSGEMDGSMLMREKNVTRIPEGLQSEYAWNR